MRTDLLVPLSTQSTRRPSSCLLDRSVWDLKVNMIIESAGYETLTVNELFSKLKATEVDNQTRAKLNGAPPSKSVALVTVLSPEFDQDW